MKDLDFEGFKRIKNEKNYSLEDLYQMIKQYENQTGKIDFLEDKIIVDVDGHYVIEITINGSDQIIIQRQIEENKTEKDITLGEDAKSLDMSQADRMIEQIYDLIVSSSTEGAQIEQITGTKKVYFAKKQKTTFGANMFVYKDEFENISFQAKENKILQAYTLKNAKTKMEIGTVNFSGIELRKYSIEISSYNIIDITIDDSHKETVKTLLKGTFNNKALVATADYTNNHYNIELNEIVIGAIDYLADVSTYRIEVNDTNYENLIMALTIIINLQYGKEQQ